MAYYYLRLKNTITNMTAKIESTKIELASTELAAKQVDKIKQELNKLNKKIDVIKTIEANRKSSIKLLDNMTKMVDEGADIQDAINQLDQSKYSKLINFEQLAGRNASWTYLEREAAAFE